MLFVCRLALLHTKWIRRLALCQPSPGCSDFNFRQSSENWNPQYYKAKYTKALSSDKAFAEYKITYVSLDA